MIEEELINEIKQDKGVDEPYSDSKIEWSPVSNIPDPYEKAPEEVKQYHKLYESLWLKHLKGR